MHMPRSCEDELNILEEMTGRIELDLVNVEKHLALCKRDYVNLVSNYRKRRVRLYAEVIAISVILSLIVHCFIIRF